ncbi:MAG: response regulator transcription factor [Bryobacteraceae bacterium]|jgi:two-component system KDP operon response regulator KdpE
MLSLNGRVLITDDDPDLRRVLRRTLNALSFDVAESSDGEQALRQIGAYPFDVVLLDVNMPGMGGVAACREIRRKSPRLQILMLTVLGKESDKVEALDAGADDYITKPFSIPELLARLRSAVRRSAPAQSAIEVPIAIGDIELHPASRTVRKAGADLRLTNKEFDVLHHLMARAGLPITHAKLLAAVWGPEYSQQVEYLRVCVNQLRKKLEDDPSSPQYLLTELHFGYRFRDPE